jgi:hypothetical protein
MLSNAAAEAFEGNASPSPILGCRHARALLLGLMVWTSGSLAASSQADSPGVASPREEATGPTLRLDFGQEASPGNPVASFMYFVRLISPAPVSCIASPGSTQVARVLSAKRNGAFNSFVVICEFEFTGDGTELSIFDLGPSIRQHEQRLKAGGSVSHQLSSITVEGAGSGTVEVAGTISNGVETVSEVRLRFNAHGKTSPVSIGLCDLRYVGGECRRFHEIVARVNTLTFRRKPGPPKMEVTVASVKNKAAGDGLWQNLKGSVKGLAVNLLIDPLTVETVGHQAMLDFGQAVASGRPTFTFPQAKNVKLSSSADQYP